MSFVTVLMTAMTGFVVLAPLAMAALLVLGGVPGGAGRSARTAPATTAGCACGEPACGHELALSRA